MKYFCEACERLVPPASYRLEFGLLVLKCSRCKVEMRCGPDVDEAPAPAPAAPPKTIDAPVIMLGVGDAEPDPIENEPTRRVAVPASVLAAIESEARENRRKKESSAPAPVAEVKISALEFVAAAKAAAAEPVVAKEVLSELPPARTPAPKFPMSEAAASNLVVLRLTDVHGRSPESKPAAEPRPAESKPVESRTVAEAAPARPSIAVRAVSESSADDPFMPPPGYCPKCIGPRKDGSVVCPFCGLEYARFRTDEFRPSPAVASTWLGVQELWESKGAHDKILALASEKGELAGLGRLYRIRLARNPDDAMAKRGREEVLRLATASSTLMPSSPPDKRAKVKTAALGLLFFILVMAAVLIIYQTRRMLAGGP